MLITDNCKDIFIGNSAITQVMCGSTVVWVRDAYPDVVWPSPYFEPKHSQLYGNNVQFFVSTGSFYLPYYWAYGDDCEGEGGRDNGYEIYNSGSTLYSGSHYKEGGTFTGTRNTWFAVFEGFDLYLNSSGTLNYTGLYLNPSRSDCGGAVDFNGDFQNIFSRITMLGVYQESDTIGKIQYCTGLQYLFCTNANGGATIDLYHSTSWTYNSMKFTVKYSPNTNFKVIDNLYWRGIIPWDMADYYNVKFYDENGNRMYR